ncbi:MAG: condensation domain-containing protein [Ruminococcus sp.]
MTEERKGIDEKRAEMSHQVIQTDEWPLFDVRITKIEDQKHRIHISFDNIIFDGWSMFHLLNEWAEVYRNGKAEMPITLSFRDYVLGLEQIKSTSAYEKDKKYWEDRVETFCGRNRICRLQRTKARLQSSVSVAGAQNCHRKNGSL